MNYNLIRVNDDLYQIIREFNPHQFLTDPKRPNWINQEYLGLWVHYLECDRVLRRNNKLLICRKIEEATIVE
jgi:hypothetical protein|tara:strand:- start:152 stop:367 length:216 start_codon:yes stop_codon:yes gene_type:complete